MFDVMDSDEVFWAYLELNWNNNRNPLKIQTTHIKTKNKEIKTNNVTKYRDREGGNV